MIIGMTTTLEVFCIIFIAFPSLLNVETCLSAPLIKEARILAEMVLWGQPKCMGLLTRVSLRGGLITCK